MYVLCLGFIGDIGFSFGGEEYDDSQDPSEWNATPILVESVTRGGIAEKAGLEPGDEIIKACDPGVFFYIRGQRQSQHS
jgi:S1-C subfamily serine protease